MQLYIDNRSGAPIYDQIYSQIKDAILSGQVAEGEALPSIRALAKDLRISVITTKRAYEELEREGFVITTPGKGCYVAPRPEGTWDQARQKQVEEYLRRGVEEAKNCAMGLAELTQLLQELYQGEK